MSWVRRRRSGAWPSATSSSSRATVSPWRSDAVDDPADGQAAEVLADASRFVTSACSGRVGVAGRRRDGVEDGVEQGGEVVVGAGHADARHRRGPPGRSADTTGNTRWSGVGGQVHEQLLDLVEHLVGPGVAAVDLVEHHDRGQVQRQRLRQHVAGLGQRALGRVDQQEHAVDHGERPLDLAAEVGVARRVDEVDLARPATSIEAALARMVMPRSRSWSLESMTRSTSAWWAAKMPVARRSASTSVVLPWSTCATSATLRSAVGRVHYLYLVRPPLGAAKSQPAGGYRSSSSSSSSSKVTPYFSAMAAYSSSSDDGWVPVSRGPKPRRLPARTASASALLRSDDDDPSSRQGSGG